jgi:hypothetical protein
VVLTNIHVSHEITESTRSGIRVRLFCFRASSRRLRYSEVKFGLQSSSLGAISIQRRLYNLIVHASFSTTQLSLKSVLEDTTRGLTQKNMFQFNGFNA